MKSIQWVTCAILLLVTAHSANAEIILNSSYIEAFAFQTAPPFDESDIIENPTLNSNGTLAAVAGIANLTMNYNLAETGGMTTFDIDYTLAGSGPYGTYDYYILPFTQFVFTAMQSGTYSLSGTIDSTGAPNEYIGITNYLSDLTDSKLLFDFSSNGDFLPVGVVTLGQAQNGEPYFNSGSTTGSILAGHKYLLTSFAEFRSAISVESSLHFEINSAMSPVPEPSSVALLTIGAMGVLGVGNRRRRLQTKDGV